MNSERNIKGVMRTKIELTRKEICENFGSANIKRKDADSEEN